MSHCPYCNRPIVPDLEPQVMFEPFDGVDEGFIVHKHCAAKFQGAYAKLKSKKAKREFVKKLLQKLSAS